MKSKTIVIKHKNLGDVPVLIDEEDEYIFKENVAKIATFKNVLKVRFYGLQGMPYAPRVILEKNNQLDYMKNVYSKNGKCLDLRKSNLTQIRGKYEN